LTTTKDAGERKEGRKTLKADCAQDQTEFQDWDGFIQHLREHPTHLILVRLVRP